MAQTPEPGRIERVAGPLITSDSVAIEHSEPGDGEHIVRAPGMTVTLDHITARPPITDLPGDVAELAVHACATLRAPAWQEW